ncbi:MAG: hypothetical protein WCD79_01100 [Chthoniobacteraceae bacterium]
MNINKLTTITVALSAAMLLNTSHGMAQDATPAPSVAATPAPSVAPAAAPSASPTGDARREEFRARMNGFIKTALKATDDEWAVIQPLLEKVQTLQRESMAGRIGGFGGFGGFGRRGGDQAAAGASASPSANNRPDRMGSPESVALKAALDSDATSTNDIKAKLQALRDARKKNTADLEQARQDLEKVLTLRQEATLVNMGILE